MFGRTGSGSALIIVTLLIILGLAESGEAAIVPFVLRLLPVILAGFTLLTVLWVINILLSSFVMPLMYQDNVLCVEGWHRFRTVSNGNLGPICLFFLIRFAYTMFFVFFMIVVVVINILLGSFVTPLMLFGLICFFPYVHHTLFAPYYLFDRAYSLYVIESLGPEFGVFLPERDDMDDLDF